MFSSECCCLSPSHFWPQVRWPYSFTRITYLSKIIRIRSRAACLQFELFRVYVPLITHAAVLWTAS
ncbi:hypothetical protein DXF93_20340 [Escherichia coli]|nr:hypothetical protein C2U51_03775 [Enterobacteriaceae bacterium ENNIH1]RDT52699.1 hypothetical protein DXF93_20340 [Escherichia coli]